jgi:cytochrome P450
MQRYTIKDWKISDGTLVPKGTFFWCNYLPMSLDEAVWENAKSFDPWRMYRLRQKPGQENKHQFVMTTPTNLTFGHGKHACPGRFFAANEIKTLLALIVMLYDFRATNLKGTIEEIIYGGWINQTKNPIDYPTVEFKYRGEEIAEDIRSLFTEV